MNKDAVSIIKSKVDKNSKVIAIGGTQLVSENIVTALVNVNSSNENDNQGSSGGGGGGSSSSNPFAGGNGTVSSPYKIATAAQLNKVRSYLNKTSFLQRILIYQAIQIGNLLVLLNLYLINQRMQKHQIPR